MGFSKFEHVKISAIAGVVPEKVINIDDEIEFYNNNPKLLERNKKILGLGTRHVVPEGVTSDDLCEGVANRIFNETNIKRNEIDVLIVVSTTNDYTYPSSACRLQGKLELSENCTCFDMNGGCSYGMHGLLNAHSLVESGVAKKVLLLISDTPSTCSDIRNRKDVMLFGDSAVGIIVEYTEQETPSYFYTGACGKSWESIVKPAGGAKIPIKKDIIDLELINKDGDVWHLWDSMLQGMDIFRFTMTYGPESIQKILDYSKFNIDDINFFAIHQANKQILQTICKKVGIPEEKYSTETFTKYANCASSSVFTVILDNINKAKDTILLSSFGIGLAWAAAVIKFNDFYNGGISIYKKTENVLSRQELIQYWIDKFTGEK